MSLNNKIICSFQNEVWLLVPVDRSSAIQLYIISFDLETGLDFLNIYDGTMRLSVTEWLLHSKVLVAEYVFLVLKKLAIVPRIFNIEIRRIYQPLEFPTCYHSVATKAYRGRQYLHLFSCCTWWRHQMETFSVLLAFCTGNSPVTGEFPAQRPVMRNFDVFFDLRLNKGLSKQSWGWWFERLSRPLWRHCNDVASINDFPVVASDTGC